MNSQDFVRRMPGGAGLGAGGRLFGRLADRADAGMRERAPYEGDIPEPGHLDIADEFGAASQMPCIFFSLNPGANAARHIDPLG